MAAWILFIISSISYSQVLEIGPYLQLKTDSSIIIRWRTIDSSSTTAKWGKQLGNSTHSYSDSQLTRNHQVLINDLNANARYYYSIGSNGTVLTTNDGEYFFETAPTAGTEKATRIWVLGDVGGGNLMADSVRNAFYDYNQDRYLDFVLLLGDNAYNNGTYNEYVTKFFSKFPKWFPKTAWWTTRGNHEFDTTVFYNFFNSPTNAEAGGTASGSNHWFSFNHGNIHVVNINSIYPGARKPGSEMIQWLEEDLANNQQKWVIAITHVPLYAGGYQDSDTGIYKDTSAELRENVLPVLEAGGLDLMLYGHSHTYQRSFLIEGHYGLSATFADSMKIDAGDGKIGSSGAYIKNEGPHEGSVFQLMGCSSVKAFMRPMPLFHMQREYVLGSVIIDIEGNHLNSKFLDQYGVIVDEFDIYKNGSINRTGTNQLSGQSTLNVYPTPFNPILHIEFPNPKRNARLLFYNVAGKLLFEKNNYEKGSFSWNAAGLPSGLVVLKVLVNNQQYVKRFFLQK